MGYLIWKTKELVEIIKRMQDEKFDALVAITGRRGLGKSTCAVQLGRKFEGFRIRRDVLFTRDDVASALMKRKKAVIIADEMINVTYNRDFFVEEQKKLIKLLNMYRDSGNLLIACIPSFTDLDVQFRRLVKIRIDVIRRGLAAIYTQNQTSFSSDPWDTKFNEKLEQSWVKKKIHKPNYSRLSTFRGMLRFGDLPTRKRELYESIKQSKRNKIYEQQVNDEEGAATGSYKQFADFAYNQLQSDKPITKPEFLKACALTGKKPSTMISGVLTSLRDRGIVIDGSELFPKENLGVNSSNKKLQGGLIIKPKHL